MKINIGLLGYNFMGKAHSFGINNAPFFFDGEVEPVKKVICGRTESKVKAAKEQYGWEEYCTDWKDVVKRDDIDLISIATPTALHKEMAIAAAENGKHIFSEKPLAVTAPGAREMLDAVKEAGVIHMLGHNYRRVPAIALAKKFIEEGKLGEIYHFRGVYLQDFVMDPDFPAIWKLKKDKAGSGPHGDLNSHIVDLSRFLVSELEEVVGMDKTFIKKRPKPGNEDEYDEGDVDDTTAFLAKFKNGALGTFEATRFAGGRKNHERIEINGSKGSLVFNFEKMNELKYWSNQEPEEEQGFKKILVTEESHPYAGYWPPGHLMGYENTFIHEYKDLFESIAASNEVKPNFYDGVKINQVLDAVLKSIDSRTWEKVDEM